MTIGKWLLDLQKRADSTAIKYKSNNEWQTISWSDYLLKTITIAEQIKGLSNKKKVHIGILSSTRWEWAILDMAIVGLGNVSVPLYPNLSDEDLLYIINHSEIKILFIENDSYLKQLKRLKPQFIQPLVIKTFDDLDFNVVPTTLAKEFFLSKCKAIKISDVATIVYTSGTTGQPKGVVLTHESVISEVTELFALVGVKPSYTALTFLPYAHVMGRTELWGSCYNGHALAFAESIEKLKSNLVEVQPDFIIAVPRIFEKIYASILSKVETQPFKKKIFKKAIEIAASVSTFRQNKETIPWLTLLQFETISRPAFEPIRKAFGGKLQFAFSGGAPLAEDLTRFFSYCGIPILEGYGLTETCAAITVNTRTQLFPGTVGHPIGDVKIKFASDGEILVRSKKCMKEYFKNPEATAEVFKDGYFATGDIGEITASGQLKITDRKKDLIKTSNGKYVAPQKLEGLLKQEPLISQVLIHGDQKKFISAVISVEEAQIKQWATSHNISYQDANELYKNPVLRLKIQDQVKMTNSDLASHEAIKKFEIVGDTWTVENGCLTPSLKIKRKFLEKKYNTILREMYE